MVDNAFMKQNSLTFLYLLNKYTAFFFFKPFYRFIFIICPPHMLNFDRSQKSPGGISSILLALHFVRFYIYQTSENSLRNKVVRTRHLQLGSSNVKMVRTLSISNNSLFVIGSWEQIDHLREVGSDSKTTPS